MNSRGTLIVVSGPSGVGKGTIVHQYLCRNTDVALSVSATTRSPRPGEIDGVHYHFISKEEFEALVSSGGMLEHAKYGSNYYGTLKSAVKDCIDKGQDIILEIECQGAMQIKKSCADALFIFVMPPSFAELHRRLSGRGTENEEDIKARLHTA
ncbi:MAG TPA: guanylate kinase, partial [Ruminococcaceae bacterium]|nr:guanylate kinase [Oscillospiraceae bacterium]